MGLIPLLRCATRQLFRIVAACYHLPMVRGSPNPLHFGIPRRLRKTRKECRITPSALGPKVGLDRHVAAYIESGNRIPTVETVARLASALGVSAGWLAYGLGQQHVSGEPVTTDGMGARLASVRTARGETKAALARAVGLSPSTVADIENGAQTGVDVLESLAKALGVSPAWLAFGEGPRELPPRRRAARAAASV